MIKIVGLQLLQANAFAADSFEVSYCFLGIRKKLMILM
jgi:hypothetical protein